jgi:hypothetical protein
MLPVGSGGIAYSYTGPTGGLPKKWKWIEYVGWGMIIVGTAGLATIGVAAAAGVGWAAGIVAASPIAQAAIGTVGAVARTARWLFGAVSRFIGPGGRWIRWGPGYLHKGATEKAWRVSIQFGRWFRMHLHRKNLFDSTKWIQKFFRYTNWRKTPWPEPTGPTFFLPQFIDATDGEGDG